MTDCRKVPIHLGVSALAGVLSLGISAQAGGAAPARGIPDFTGFWAHGVTQIVFQPIPGQPSPVIDVLNVECTPDCPPRVGGTPFIGDYSNPILTPAAADAVRTMGERWRSEGAVNAATELCMPSGVPHVLTIFAPVQFLQEEDMITVLYQRDMQVRRVHLNAGHSENLKPSWYGESVGHYEGDLLVVDTIGLDSRSIVDRFGAPQTEATHVVERYRIIDGGNALLAHVTVEDPDTFTTAWSGTITYNRNRNTRVISEEICAENNKDAATGEDYPIPIDASPDF